MPITSMAGRLMNVYRRSAYLAAPQATPAPTQSLVLSGVPAAGAYVQVTVEGTPASFGQAFVTGTVGGAPTVASLTFTAPATLVTTQRFDAGSITALDLTGWGAGGTWSARAVGADGSRIHSRSTVATAVRCHLNRGAAAWPMTTAGKVEREATWLAHDWTDAWAPREGDVYVDQGTGEEWRVVGDPNWLGSLRPHHWEVRVHRREGSLDT